MKYIGKGLEGLLPGTVTRGRQAHSQGQKLLGNEPGLFPAGLEEMETACDEQGWFAKKFQGLADQVGYPRVGAAGKEGKSSADFKYESGLRGGSGKGAGAKDFRADF